MEHIRRDIELDTGERRTALFTIAPIAVNQYTVSIGSEIGQFEVLEDPVIEMSIAQLFIGTRRRTDSALSPCGVYITLRNRSVFSVSGTIKLITWQDHTGERDRSDRIFDIPPDDIGRAYWDSFTLREDTIAYARFELEIDDILLYTTEFYFMPGKVRSGSTARGSCEYSFPGFAMLYYWSPFETNQWNGWYRTPPTLKGNKVHSGTIYLCRTYHYDGKSTNWHSVFLPIFDSGFLSGHRYEAGITGSHGNLTAIFEWNQQ